MSQEIGFKLLSETSYLTTNEDCVEPCTIFENFSTDSSYNNKPLEIRLEDGQTLSSDLREKFDFDNLSCKPLEEIDPEYYRQKTFLAIGADSTVRRFSGRRSPFILNPLKPLRRVGIYLLSHWHLPVIIGISLCLLCLSLILPNYPYNNSATFIRYFFSFVLVSEICVNALARGVLVDEFTYLRNPWHWLDVGVLTIIFLCNFFKTPVLHSLQGVALLKFIPLFPVLRRNGFHLTIETFKNLVPVLIYFLLSIWILVVFGLHFQRYENPFTIKCPNNQSLVLNLNDTSLTFGHERNDIHKSEISFSDECEGFAALYTTSLRFLELITTRLFGGLPYENNALNQSFILILLTLTFGTFGIGVFTTASFLDSFLQYESTTKPYENINKPNKFKICDKLPKLQTPNCDLSALNAINEVFYHPFFELLVTTIIVFDIILALVAESLKESSESHQSMVHHGQQVCMVFYVIEFALKLLSGPFRYIRNRWTLLDIFVVGIYVLDKSVYPLSWVLLIRVFKITPRWPTLYSMFRILSTTLKCRFQMIFVLSIFLFSYLIGSRQIIAETEDASLLHFVYLFQNWFLKFQLCSKNLGPNLCIPILLLEIIIAVFIVVLIFTIVIQATTIFLAKPTVYPENYKKLVKAVEVIKSVFGLKLCCSKNDKTPKIVITSNGGGMIKVPNELELNCNHCNSDSNTVIEESGQSVDKHSKITGYVSLVIILIATISSVLDYGKPPLSNPRFWIDLSFVIYFFIALLIKSIIRGWRMLISPSWVFDFLIVSASVFTLYLAVYENSTVGGLVIMKAVGCCKGLMLISRLEWTRETAIGIMKEICSVWRYLIAISFVYFYFIVLKTQLPVEIINYLSGSVVLNDTLQTDSYQVVKIFPFMTFCILTGGILVGVILFQLLKNNLLNSFMTSAQLKIYKDKNGRRNQEKTVIIPYPKRRICMQIIHYVTLTDAFDLTVMSFILCDCLVITLSPFATSKDWKIIWSFYPLFIVCLYLFEIIVKMFGWRKHFFKSKWNIFDLMILIVGIIDVLLIRVQFKLVSAELIRFLRILRVFQLKPLLRRTKLIQIFYTSLLRIVPILWNLLLLYLIFLYSYTAIGVVNLKSSLSGESITEAFQLFKNISVSLILMPYYPVFYQNNLRILKETNNIAQSQSSSSCWEGYEDFLWTFYLNSYLAISYLFITNFYAIYVCEIFKEVDKDLNYQTCSNNSNANKEISYYKHTNGGLLTVQSPDDVISMETMLTPIESNATEDGLFKSNDDDDDNNKYPMQISANGYIIHVEAIVSSV